MKLAWAGALILTAAALVALWLTAHRVRERKLAARAGGEPAGARLEIPRGGSRAAGHLTLEAPTGAGGLRVLDARGVGRVEFTRLKPGVLRRWQELELRFLRVDGSGLAVEPAMRPGAPSFGSGLYLDPRPGLRVEFSGARSVTVLAADPPGFRLEVAAPGETREVTLREGGEERAFGLHLRRTGADLLLEDPEE